MMKKQSDIQKSRTLARSRPSESRLCKQRCLPCRYAKGHGGIIVYDGLGRLRLELTTVYRALARRSTAASARATVSALHKYLMVAESRGLGWNADIKEVTGIVKLLFELDDRVEVSQVLGRVTVHANGNVNTVRSILTNLRSGFAHLIELGIRQGVNPIKRYSGARGDLGRHTHVARYGGHIPGEGLLGSFQVTGMRPIPTAVNEGDTLPDALRTAFHQVGACVRDLTVYEWTVSSAARLTETAEATFAGLVGGLKNTILVHNKGQGRAASKPVNLTAEAQHLYRRYFAGDRLRHDRLSPEFLRWLGRREITPEHYCEFLESTYRDPGQFPLFLTVQGLPYTAATFRRQIWSDANRISVIRASPHHLRHCYVNRRLKEIAQEYAHNPYLHITKLLGFVRHMGWRNWQSMRPYDYEGVAMIVLTKYFGDGQRRGRHVDHGGTGEQLMERMSSEGLHPPVRGQA